jgi:hypothetical protein
MANNGANLPLAINVVGPMALQKNNNSLDIWLPNVGSAYKHEAGIATNIDSMKLDVGDYSLLGPTAATTWPTPYCPTMPDGDPSDIYILPKPKAPAKYIHITLPIPWGMVCLSPASCEIYDTTPTNKYKYWATGVRLLYQTTGSPSLEWSDASGQPYTWPLPIDIAPGENHVEVAINYHPVVHDENPQHPEATSDFKSIAAMVGLTKLNIQFNPSATGAAAPAARGARRTVGPVHDCITPIGMI